MTPIRFPRTGDELSPLARCQQVLEYRMSSAFRLIGRVLGWIGLSLMSGSGFAQAAIITQTQVRPFSISAEEQIFSWQQFNPMLGTLLSVEYQVDATLSGSFSVTNLSTSRNVTLRNSQNFFENAFIGAGAPAIFPGTTLTPIPTNPVTDAIGTVVPFSPSGSFVQVISVSPTPQPLSVTLTDLTFASTYFTGLGTINSTIAQFPEVNVTGSRFEVDMHDLIAAGEARLIYRFDDTGRAVPEPSTALVAGAGLATFAILRFRRKAQLRIAPRAV